MKPSISCIIRQVEDWTVDDIERLMDELDSTSDMAGNDTCLDCGNRKLHDLNHSCILINHNSSI